MKFPCMLLFGFLIPFTIAAQNKSLPFRVTGQIIEKTSQLGIPYATVVLHNDSLHIKKMQACDVSGHFGLSADTACRYMVSVSAVGFKTLNLPLVISDQNTDLGKLSLEEGTEIEEVTITAQKPLVRVDPDKIVYSIESDPEAQSNNTLQMLSKVPLIIVDAEENITLNGQSNFKILVNGKSSSLMSNNFKEVLKSIPANTIKDIEVITNPSSKYDAEGVGGIINIITTKKTLNGYHGSVGSGTDSYGSYNWSTYLTVKIKKITFSGNYYEYYYTRPKSHGKTDNEYYENADYHYSCFNSENFYAGHSKGFTGEASYEIDSLNLISMSFSTYVGYFESTGNNGTQFCNISNEITRSYTSTNKMKSSYGSISGNIDYQKTFKKPDKSFTISYNLDNDPNSSLNKSAITGVYNYPTYNQHSENKALGSQQTLQTDYFNPLSDKHQIEGGLKCILRQNTSTSETLRNDTIRVSSGNDLDYSQYILGMYAGYLYKLKKFSAKGGLRLERTWNDGTSMTIEGITKFNNRLFNLIPYITFSWMPKPDRTIKLSYTQRLSRPGIWYLNPYVNNQDSMNINHGNPSLVAEISNVFEFGYTYFTPKINLSFNSSAAFVNNSIERRTKILDNGARETTYENIGKDQSYGMNIYGNYRPSAKINIYCNLGLRYTRMETHTDYSISNSGFSVWESIGGRWTAWKNGSVNLNSWFSSASYYLQGKYSANSSFSMGISQFFLQRKLMIYASISEPFCYEKKYENDFGDKTFISHSENYYRARALRVGLSLNFGKMNVEIKKARRGIQNDDVKSNESQPSS